MPLQNRVDPFGQIHAVSARGALTGNRGVIHDPATRTLLKRRWSTKAWIFCVCDFRGRRREVMGRNAPSGSAGWTELFFLDEVTALAAGHRPCFYCQRERALEFAAAFGRAFSISQPKAGEIDARLHRERLASGGTAVTLAPTAFATAGQNAWADIDLPDGTIVAQGVTTYAIRNGTLLPWSFSGYGAPVRFSGALSPFEPMSPEQSATDAHRTLTYPPPRPEPRRSLSRPSARAYAPSLNQAFTIVTPPTTLATLRAGFRPRFATSQT